MNPNAGFIQIFNDKQIDSIINTFAIKQLFFHYEYVLTRESSQITVQY